MSVTIWDYFSKIDLQDLWRIVQEDGEHDRLFAVICRMRGLPAKKSDYSYRKIVGSKSPNCHQDVFAGMLYGITQELVVMLPARPFLPIGFTGLIFPTGSDEREGGVLYQLFPFAPVDEDVSLCIDSRCTDLFRRNSPELTEYESVAIREGIQRGQPTAGCIRGECREDSHKSHRFYLNRFQLEDLMCWLSGYFPD
ncbi:MAG: hypothetical protein A2805_00485 [Candidatus Andersenbacteria bacterium RIFCSPHIGHO2_01_FULL_46_36]|uniref:Uncharacterized protein n=1 Tax=Candidatus Andersenbacteria bacterium RIFCSPHIGHO2_12_FULL_45_11 TaxID=1797281 RepID=A0A1G1WZJ5_9BACT|nr:MAG: hypothetical protein A2805_00485 [Candidatus Andersenbacteria bacterium RIFCSPHIGHO2_01_FULL_46_36]OGY33133.1 MAG: hypothetical protein A3D99_01590 [Candidatus Andersenbacteria bacterium RIFCSPHIGHO2_12_FULL_45_11]